MVWLTVMILALGLASDASAVAIATAVRARQVPLWGGLSFACWCGLFQGVMPALGYVGAVAAGGWLAAIDHWVAFVVLGAIGVKLAIEGLRAPEESAVAPWPGLRLQLSLALATSIDALVAGVMLPALGLGILGPALLIGGMTAVLVFAGALLGRHIGMRLGRWAEVVGGVLLILIGTRILISHLLEA